MNAESVTLWAALISGGLGGGLAVVGALAAVMKGIRDLEQTEVRTQRVACITNLYGLRFILSEGYAPRPEDVTRFMFEINRAGALFAEYPDILNDLRDFYDAVSSKQPDATARFISLVKKMGRHTALKVESLSDTDVRKTFAFGNTNIVVQFIPVPVAGGPATGNQAQTAQPIATAH